MWPLKTIAYLCLFWVGCVMSLRNPIWGVVTYIMVYHTNPAETWWGKPLTDSGLRLSLLAALAILGGLVFGRRRVPKLIPSLSAWEVGVAAIVLIAAMSLILGVAYNDETAFAFEKLWKTMVFVIILARLGSTRENLKTVLWALTIGCLYLGWDAYNAPSSAFLRGRLEIIGGPDISTSSGAAGHLTAMLPLIGAIFLTTPSWRWKLVSLAAGALSVNTIIMCRTRSAFIGLAVGVAVAILVAPKVRRFRVRAALAIALLGGVYLTDQHYLTRMNTLAHHETYEQDRATVSRTEIWRHSVEMFHDHPLGIGTGNFLGTIGQYDYRYSRRSTHNTIVVAFVELGAQGGLVFLSLCAGSVWLLWRASRMAHLTSSPVETKVLAYGLFVALVTYFFTGLGTERFYCESYWWVLTLPLCLHRAVSREVYAERYAHLLAPEELDDLEDHALPGTVLPADYACREPGRV